MRAPGWVPRLWPALPAAVYLLLPTRNFYWDGVAFAINVEKGLPLKDTLHPNHLIYTAIWVWLYRLGLALGVQTRALFLMQTANSVLAAACVWLVYRALRRRSFTEGGAAAAALVFAFAATWWKFATDANAYIPAIFFLLCANDLLERGRGVVPAALLHAAAMLFHQLAIFYLPVALWRARGLRQKALYAAASLGPVAAAYLLAAREVGVPLATWITAHSSDSGFSFDLPRNLGLTLAGTARLFFGGRLSAVRPGPATLATLAALVCCAAALVWQLARGGRPRFARPSWRMLAWIAIYAAFLFFWMPQNVFYRLFYLPPLVVALACALRPTRTARHVPALACAVVALWNFAFLTLPQSRAENNAPLRFALEQRALWPPGTPVAFHRFHPDLWTISYFTPECSWIGLDTADTARLDRALEDARTRDQSLYLEQTAYDFLAADANGRRWLAAHESAGLLHFHDPRHDFRFYRVR